MVPVQVQVAAAAEKPGWPGLRKLGGGPWCWELHMLCSFTLPLLLLPACRAAAARVRCRAGE